MDPIEGVPEGYRLGEVVYLREDRQNITFELMTIEQPKQLEAVIVVPIRELGYDTEVTIRSMLLKGITPALAEDMRGNAPEFITIREKGKKQMGRDILMDPIEGPCCAHAKVHYFPVELAPGRYRDRWQCANCCREFTPLISTEPMNLALRSADLEEQLASWQRSYVLVSDQVSRHVNKNAQLEQQLAASQQREKELAAALAAKDLRHARLADKLSRVGNDLATVASKFCRAVAERHQWEEAFNDCLEINKGLQMQIAALRAQPEEKEAQ